MKRLLTLTVLLFLLLTACTTQDAAPAALYSDGLLHEPYGWDNLYGSKEVPEKWWQRTPRDPVAGEETEIAIAAGKQLKDRMDEKRSAHGADRLQPPGKFADGWRRADAVSRPASGIGARRRRAVFRLRGQKRCRPEAARAVFLPRFGMGALPARVRAERR